MSKANTQCQHCKFKAKTASGLATHHRSKHSDKPKRHKKFDLEITSTAQAYEFIAHLNTMMNTAGWHLLVQITEGNIAVLEEAILERKDPQTKQRLSDEELEDARRKREAMKGMIERPQRLIDMYKINSGANMPTYDPYAVDVRQFDKNSRVGQPSESTLKTE